MCSRLQGRLHTTRRGNRASSGGTRQGTSACDRWRACSSKAEDDEVHNPDSEVDAAVAEGGGYRSKGPKWRKKYLRVLPFEEARKCAQKLSFDSREQWDEWVDEGKRSPYLGPYMPSAPDEMYGGEGWEGWDDFLGIPFAFETARDYARSLHLNSVQDWWAHCNGDNLPARVPSRPDWVYRNDGFSTYEDWLGCDPPKDVARSSDIPGKQR